MATKRIPYGITDFDRICRENRYYVDKTDFIPLMEESEPFVMYLRPRRFGKTLMLAVLDAYYNVKYKDRFDFYFKDLKVYQNLTEKRSSYLVMKFNFSKVDNNIERVYSSFNENVKNSLRIFVNQYAEYLPADTLEKFSSIEDCDKALDYVLSQVLLVNQRIFMLIDEYDNFANSLLSRNENDYVKLTHGDGFFRLFFNILKAHTSGMESPIERIFITGVSPLTLSDVTSGYNIGKNYSLKSEYNSMVGFTEAEVRSMLEYYRDEKGNFNHSIDEIMDLIKPWYNNYCFNEECVDDDRVFNSDMLWYFLSEYVTNGKFPRAMVDTNIRTDYDKMRMLIRYDKSFGRKASIIQQIINEGEISAVINPEFSISELDNDDNLISLLFYLGMLSIKRYDYGITYLAIPNITVKMQFYMYMKKCYEDCIMWRSDDNEIDTLGHRMAYFGQAVEFIDYIVSCMKELSDPRDFDPQAEAFVKGFILATMGVKMNFFTIDTECALNHGYSDIFIKPSKDAKHAFVVELKYLKANASDAEVLAKEKEAEEQLRQYLADRVEIRQLADKGISCRGIILVMSGCKKRVLRYL